MTCTVHRSPYIRLWILGLNHSGTTIVWRSFRGDARFLCFDEPLTGNIGVNFPGNNEKCTQDEYIRCFGVTPKKFWRIFAPIGPLQELDVRFTAAQEAWLRCLLDHQQHVVIDETHCHLHLDAIKGFAPESHVVHLYRRAGSFATSHLRPSYVRRGSISRRLGHVARDRYNATAFWTRADLPPGMRRDEVIGSHKDSKFGLLLAEAGYDVDRIMCGSAVVRLLAYWHYHYRYLQREGPRVFGDRFRSLSFETFTGDPVGAMRELYEWSGVPLPAHMEYPDVYAAKRAYRPNDRRWREAARVAGFSGEEIETLL